MLKCKRQQTRIRNTNLNKTKTSKSCAIVKSKRNKQKKQPNTLHIATKIQIHTAFRSKR